MTSVSQVGTDRILEIVFSDGQYRLFLEFYAGGNIVLTDQDLTVISLLRIVNEENEQLRVGQQYSLHNRQNYRGIPPLTRDRIREGLERHIEKWNNDAVAPRKGGRKKPGDALRKALASFLNELPPFVIDHAFKTTKFNPLTPVGEILENGKLMSELVTALEEAQNLVESVTSSDVVRGFIIAKQSKNATVSEVDVSNGNNGPPRENMMYEDFQPFRPQHLENEPGMTILEFDGFNKTVDEFFSSIESQKISSRLTEREENARRKLETAKLDHEKRLGGLQKVQEMNVRKAQAIEANLAKVKEAIAAVNGLLAQGMDWMDIARLIELEKSKNNVVAEMINLPLKLYQNSVTLLLMEATLSEEDNYDGEKTDSSVSDSNEDEQSPSMKPLKPDEKRLAVDIDLALSPWSNARLYYEQKKFAAVKEQKTLQSSEKALKSTEKKINIDLKKGLKQEKEVMRPLRQASWFEKFVYFISSEGYLVIGGKDAQQNEILYKRYLKKGDVYVHADLHGAASVIVKNKIGMLNSPIPPSTLSQAGTLAVATSSAWESKAGMAAWWVSAEQVSKTAPAGEYLTTGSFTIRGHKNFLPPAHLLLGFGLLFKVSEESKARHLKHRIQDEVQVSPKIGAERTDHVEAFQPGDNDQDNLPSNVENLQKHDEYVENETDNLRDQDETSLQGESMIDSEEDSGSDESEPEEQNPLQPIRNRHVKSQSQRQDSVVTKERQDTDTEASVSSEPKSSKEQNVQSTTSEQLQGASEVLPSNTRTRHLSAKERRLLRKGTPTTNDSLEATKGVEGLKEITDELDPLKTAQIEQPMVSATQSQPAVRGKHGKRSKLKTKYADQDEEDRALAMRLLGSAAAQQKAKEDAVAKATKDRELADQKERRRKQHETAAAKGKELEEIRRLNFEEGIEPIDEEEVGELNDLDGFVGAPLPGDEILDVLVMSGPWDAIGGRCRWKAKLQPGTTKKGKAVREILGKWLSMIADREKKKRPGSGEGNEDMIREEKVRMREAELIKAIREPEVVGIVPVSKVRVMLGPGDASGKGKGGGGAGRGKRGGRRGKS